MLFGTIFGDIVGSQYECNCVKNNDFDLITDRIRFTDDTVMTLAVASWLIKDKNNPTVLIKELQYYGNRYPHAGYGGSFARWLRSELPQPYYSYGNGSAMRVSPCAWVAKSLEECQYLAEISASVTHNHPDGIKGAQAIASAIYMARQGYSKHDIKTYISEKYDYDLNRSINDIINSGYKFEVSCQDSVPESIIAFLEGENYINCIRKAISLKGDADTQAAIAGSIAEAYYGFPNDLTKVVNNTLDDYLNTVLIKFNEIY